MDPGVGGNLYLAGIAGDIVAGILKVWGRDNEMSGSERNAHGDRGSLAAVHALAEEPGNRGHNQRSGALRRPAYPARPPDRESTCPRNPDDLDSKPVDDDVALLTRWRNGDLKAGDRLLRQYVRPLRCFFENKVGEATEDLVQLTLERCLRIRDQFEGRSSFRTYLFGTGRQVLLEYVRRRSPRRRPDFDVESLAVLGLSPSRALSARLGRQEILMAMRDLPLNHQLTLELHYWHGLSIPQLAETMEVPAGTVKSRLYYGRRGLARILGTSPRFASRMRAPTDS